MDRHDHGSLFIIIMLKAGSPPQFTKISEPLLGRINR